MLRQIYILSRLWIILSLQFYVIPLFSQEGFSLKFIAQDTKVLIKGEEDKPNHYLKDSLSVLKRLKQFADKYFRDDFITFTYDSILWKEKLVTAYYSAGSKFLIDTLILNLGEECKKLPSTIFPKSGSVIKMGYHDFLKFREEIIAHYENNGHPFAMVILNQIQLNENSLRGALDIMPNQLVTIDSVILKGNPRITEKLLYYYLRLKPGSIYQQSKIDMIDKILDELGYIKPAKPAEIEFRNNQAAVYLYLKNTSSNFFNGIVGFASDSLSGKGIQLTGDLNLILTNSFKSGERIDLSWNSYSKGSQNLRLGVNLPYIYVLPLGIATNIGFDKFSEGYLNTEFYASLSYNYSGKNKLNGYFRNRNSFLIGKDDELMPDNRNFKSRIAGLGISIDRTDYLPNPSKGYYIDILSGLGKSIIEDGESNSLMELQMKANIYFKITGLFGLVIRNSSGALLSPDGFYKNQLYKLGGLNLLRGFDEKSILASGYTVFSVEPFISFGKGSGFFIFYDFAWYEARMTDKYFEDKPFGTGAGLNIETGAGIFKLVYALGKQLDNPLKFSESKVHFGFYARF